MLNTKKIKNKDKRVAHLYNNFMTHTNSSYIFSWQRHKKHIKTFTLIFLKFKKTIVR